MSDSTYSDIDINLIDFDLDNPRIIKELASHAKDKQMENAGALLLLSNNDQPGPAREELQKSIEAHGGIWEPIQLVPLSGNKYKVVEGNTRLAVYKQFNKANPEDIRWHKISSCIHNNASKEQLDDMRLLAHFMPKKQWSMYAKGQYINSLTVTKDFKDIAEILGGKVSTIRDLKNAYIFFVKHFESLFVGNANYAGADESKFSHFVEAGKSGVSLALESHFGSLEKGQEEFGKWVKNGKFRMAIHVRQLPAVFNNDTARQAFIDGTVSTIEDAKDLLPKAGDIDIKLNDAEIEQLSDQLTKKINSVDRMKMESMKGGLLQPTVDSLYLLALDLTKLLDEIDE